MEGKLIKMVEGYTLSLTGSVDDLYGISNHQLAEEHQLQKLSLKNCEAIENGYDLDELAKLSYKCDPYIAEYLEQEFKRGFQKALEILNNKKFSETELYRAFLINSSGDNFTLEKRFNETILPMFQESEWDVEIVTEPMNLDEIREQGKGFLNSNTNKPKLDANGCLILKGI
jgi:hypothetical protein